MSNRLLLSLETATLAGSIALSRGSKMLATHTGKPEISHSNTLLADIDQLLLSGDLSIRDIDLFAVATGPGSFTGLRIGLASVKALASTLDRPCIGVPTLEAIAHSGGVSKLTVALLPAGRGEVFVQMFLVPSIGSVVALDQPQHISPAKAIERYANNPTVRWLGDGARLHANLIQEYAKKFGHELVQSAEEKYQVDSEAWSIGGSDPALAEHVAALATSRAEDGFEQMANSLQAIYVRPSDAEMKL